MAYLEWLKTIGSSIGTMGKPIVCNGMDGNAIFPKALSSGELRVSSREYIHSILEGDIPNHTIFNKYITCAIATTPNQFFSTEGYKEQSSGAQRSIVSSSSNDTNSSGTGCRVVRIDYINGSGGAGSEYINLNGTTPVNTVSTSIRHINQLQGVSFGSGGVAAGKISLYTGTGGTGTVFCAISIGDTKDNNAHYYVPSDKTLYIDKYDVIFTNFGNYTIYVTSTDGSYTWVDKLYTGYVNNNISMSTPFTVPGNGSIKFYITVSKTNTLASINLLGWIE